MKTILIGLSVIFASFSAYADWNGDLLCTPESPVTHGELVADAKGRVTVTVSEGIPYATFTLDDVRLYSGYGRVKGSIVKNTILKGEVGDGNDAWFSTASPVSQNTLIQSIDFDLSSLDRGWTRITTKKGNVYQTYCTMRRD